MGPTITKKKAGPKNHGLTPLTTIRYRDDLFTFTFGRGPTLDWFIKKGQQSSKLAYVRRVPQDMLIPNGRMMKHCDLPSTI